MSEAGKLFLLAGAELRDRWRWARQHLYALLILSPLVLGMTYMTLVRAASYDAVVESPAPSLQILSAVLTVLALLALNLSRASREIYHLRQAAVFTEALPLKRVTHLHVALLARMARALALSLLLLALRSLLRDEWSSDLVSLGALVLFQLLMALAELYAALNWIHWGHTRHKMEAARASLLLIMVSAVGGLLLLFFFNPAALLEMGGALAASTSSPAARDTARLGYALCGVGSVLAVMLYALARRSHERWRAADIDYAQRLRQGSRVNLEVAAHVFFRRLPRSVASMLIRDLRLTLRIFSSAVYVTAGLCVLLILLLVGLLTTEVLPSGPEFIGGLMAFGWASATWLPAVISVKVMCVAAAAALSCVLPVLVYYQLPHLWLERAAGATGEDVWKAKLWYARLLTLPVVLAVYLVGVVAGTASNQGGGVPLLYIVPLLAECLWLWWMVGTIAGMLAFEIPDRPELTIILVLTLSISTGALSALLWPMGLAIYGIAFAQAAERGMARARYYLATEGE